MPTIPEELMNRLHDATERFRQARLRAEDEIDKCSQGRRAELATALAAAEKDLEDVTAEIDKLLPPPTPPGNATTMV